MDFNDGDRQKREITFQQCKKMQIEMIEWRRDFGIVTTILAAILLGAMIVFIIYCCSKRNFFKIVNKSYKEKNTKIPSTKRIYFLRTPPVFYTW